MREKLLRFSAITLSVLLLSASVGVIFWIAQDEHSRLANRERAALEAAEEAARREAVAANGTSEADGEAAEKMFHDIDTLVAELSMDDLPIED